MPVFPLISHRLKKQSRWIQIATIAAVGFSLLVAWPLAIAAVYSGIVNRNLRQNVSKALLIGAMIIPALFMEFTWGKTVVAALSQPAQSRPATQVAQANTQTQSTPQVQGASDDKSQTAKVLRAISGDTLDVDIDGSPFRVKLIGLKAPAVATKKTGQAECFGPESQMFLDSLLKGHSVRLLSDPSLADQDKADIQRYVEMTDGTEVNSLMLEAGLARASSQEHQYIATYRAEQQAAKQAKKGLWLNCHKTADQDQKQQEEQRYPQITTPSTPTPTAVKESPAVTPISKF